ETPVLSNQSCPRRNCNERHAEEQCNSPDSQPTDRDDEDDKQDCCGNQVASGKIPRQGVSAWTPDQCEREQHRAEKCGGQQERIERTRPPAVLRAAGKNPCAKQIGNPETRGVGQIAALLEANGMIRDESR